MDEERYFAEKEAQYGTREIEAPAKGRNLLYLIADLAAAISEEYNLDELQALRNIASAILDIRGESYD